MSRIIINVDYQNVQKFKSTFWFMNISKWGKLQKVSLNLKENGKATTAQFLLKRMPTVQTESSSMQHNPTLFKFVFFICWQGYFRILKLLEWSAQKIINFIYITNNIWFNTLHDHDDQCLPYLLFLCNNLGLNSILYGIHTKLHCLILVSLSAWLSQLKLLVFLLCTEALSTGAESL